MQKEAVVILELDQNILYFSCVLYILFRVIYIYKMSDEENLIINERTNLRINLDDDMCDKKSTSSTDVQEKRYVILEKIRKNCLRLSIYHNAKYYFYKNLLFGMFRLPLIILSGVNSFSAVGLQPYVTQDSISLLNAMLSLLCGILTSIELLLNLQKRMENELETHKLYYALNLEIYAQLKKSPEDRGDHGDLEKYLNEKFNAFKSLVSHSNSINVKNRKFKDEFEFRLDDDDMNENI